MTIEGEQTYRAGIATTDITPPVGTPLGGYADRYVHTSTGVYHPLRAVAVAIEDDDCALVLVSAEWLGFYEQADRVRAMVSGSTGLPVSNIVLSATHTHCGPALGSRERAYHGWIDENYLQVAMEKIAEAAGQAWRHRYPATLRYGTAQCDVAMNRRFPQPTPAGSTAVTMAPNPVGPVDHDVGVLVVESAADGAPRGVVFSYSCHPTSRDGLQIGGDYVGFAYEYLDQRLPTAQPCFLQGCAGDQKPKPLAGDTQFTRRTVDEVREIGYELGRAVDQLLHEDCLDWVHGPLAIRQTVVELQTEELDDSALRAELTNPELAYRRRWAEHHLRRLEEGLRTEREVPFEIQTMSFGRSLAVVAMAGEMTVEHGTRLKRELGERFAHVLPLGYANGMVGYVPVERQFKELGYEVLDANQYFLRTGRYLSDTESRIHDTVRAMLRSADERS
jgi:neutral ceramidase